MLQNRVLETLRKIGIEAKVKPGRRPLELPEGAQVWLLGPAQLEVLALPRALEERPATLARLAPGLPRLWIAEHVPTRTAMRWIEAGRAFVDAAGNAFLTLPGLFVRVLGNGPTAPVRALTNEKGEREWRAPALRVLFHLLCDPQLAGCTYRKLAELCDVAPGTAVQLFQDLERGEHLARVTRRERRFTPNRELLDLWLQGYRRKLRPALRLGRFTALDPDWQDDFDALAYDAVWGAETAAARLGEDLVPGIHTLYTTTPPTALLQAARLRADPNGEVELRQIFWTDQLETATPDTAPVLLIAADLLAIRDGRCRTVGEHLLERVI